MCPKIRNGRSIVLLILYGVFFVFSASAERITFSANSMTGTAGNTSDATTLSGSAYVLTSSMEIAADSITMSGKNFRYIEADGNITGKNLEAKMEFTCARLSYDRQTKIATLKDDVHLADTENGVSVDAQLIEYNQNTDIARIQIGITIKQKDNVCSSAYAVYRKKNRMLEMSGNARITQGEDTFRAQQITLNLDTQEITLDGRVKGSVVDDKSAGADNAAETDPQPAAAAEDGSDGESAGRGESTDPGRGAAAGENPPPDERARGSGDPPDARNRAGARGGASSSKDGAAEGAAPPSGGQGRRENDE